MESGLELSRGPAWKIEDLVLQVIETPVVDANAVFPRELLVRRRAGERGEYAEGGTEEVGFIAERKRALEDVGPVVIESDELP